MEADYTITCLIRFLFNSILQTYDVDGRVLSRTSRNGHTTSFEYGSFSSQPTKIIHPDGEEENFTYNFFGQITTSTDELGHVTTFTYDVSGRPASTTSPNGQTTTDVYDGQFLTQQITKINSTQNLFCPQPPHLER